MKRISWLISRYLIGAIMPYFAFSWLLLSVILFIQQASKFTDIFFNVNIPVGLIWQLTIALVPNVIAFTCPMAMLVGTIIGLSKMQGDSELITIRVAGVSNLQIAAPIVLIGIALSIFAFVVNLQGVPLAASLVRSVALQTAIRKLESPIEPGVFNTEVAGYTIFVKSGDLEKGTWQNIFIHSEDQSNSAVRLITSSNGRLDFTDQQTELVLNDATTTTIPVQPGTGKYITENIGEVRVAVKTKRSELIERLSSSNSTPEELGLSQLSELVKASEGKDRTEAQILWQRRIILSVTPLIFCLLGTVLILRFNRGGRGFGLALAFGGLIAYYLLTFAGEQLARTGSISVFAAGLIPIGASLLAITWLSYRKRYFVSTVLLERLNVFTKQVRSRLAELQIRNIFVDLTTGLRDLDLIVNLVKYFVFSTVFLSVVFVIFTAFELWKFAGVIEGGALLLGKYLFFLLPFVYLQLAPSAAMIATLATYVIKSRQNEIVTWTSAGQSVYRLLVPCFVFMAMIGAVNWLIQERLTPRANQLQDDYRSQIRKGGASQDKAGAYWVSDEQRIYTFRLDDPNAADPAGGKVASDNEKRCGDNIRRCVKQIMVGEFGAGDQKLQTVYRAPFANWESGKLKMYGDVEKVSLIDGGIAREVVSGFEIAEDSDPFDEIRGKPSHLRVGELERRSERSESEVERRSFAVAVQKRYSTPLLPLIIALFTAPFALSLSRKGKVITIGYAIGLWLLFIGTTSIFAQFGESGSLSPFMSVWSPLLLFSMLGVYLLSRVRT